MGLSYQNPDGIEDRYVKTVILRAGNPIYVEQYLMRDPTGKIHGALHYRDIGPNYNKDQYVAAEDDTLADGPFLLGYMNNVAKFDLNDEQKKVPVFVSRVPVRKFKQGLSAANLSFAGRAMGYAHALPHPGFRDLLKNEFPSIRECAAALRKKDTTGMAYHRHWAFMKTRLGQIELHYRNNPVGIGDDVDSVKLAKPFQYLKEAYEIGVANAC